MFFLWKMREKGARGWGGWGVGWGPAKEPASQCASFVETKSLHNLKQDITEIVFELIS